MLKGSTTSSRCYETLPDSTQREHRPHVPSELGNLIDVWRLWRRNAVHGVDHVRICEFLRFQGFGFRL